ncbi:MAG: hypothetical protein CMJ81_06135 [Planctomycetaceae bacterium]|nr:hypothetical protein [Planctomycetaceae bacterium]
MGHRRIAKIPAPSVITQDQLVTSRFPSVGADHDTDSAGRQAFQEMVTLRRKMNWNSPEGRERVNSQAHCRNWPVHGRKRRCARFWSKRYDRASRFQPGLRD